MRPETKKLL